MYSAGVFSWNKLAVLLFMLRYAGVCKLGLRPVRRWLVLSALTDSHKLNVLGGHLHSAIQTTEEPAYCNQTRRQHASHQFTVLCIMTYFNS